MTAKIQNPVFWMVVSGLILRLAGENSWEVDHAE